MLIYNGTTCGAASGELITFAKDFCICGMNSAKKRGTDCEATLTSVMCFFKRLSSYNGISELIIIREKIT